MVDKNLFPYNLAVVAIFKNEASYLREWLDYHLLAGVEHFYLYNNDSADDYAEVLTPYVEANLVTLIDWSGKVMQMPAYNDALERFRFFCRYMAFIDLDEFIFPKTGQSIVEIVDKILSRDESAAALGINWQIFGSNGHDTADYSRGVLERFTRRAEKNFSSMKREEIYSAKGESKFGNLLVKTIANPRETSHFYNPHFAVCFNGFQTVNENGRPVEKFFNVPITADKIVVNHYYIKSREEFLTKFNRGRSDIDAGYHLNVFDRYDINDVFDDDILKYRARRAESFSLEDDATRFRRVEKVLIDTLTAQSPFDASAEFFAGKLETFLTCRKLAELLGTRIGSKSAEEYALVWIYQTLNTDGACTYADLQLFVDELPEILSRPFPTTKKILRLTCDGLIPTFCEALKEKQQWEARTRLLDLRKFLNLLR